MAICSALKSHLITFSSLRYIKSNGIIAISIALLLNGNKFTIKYSTTFLIYDATFLRLNDIFRMTRLNVRLNDRAISRANE